MSIDVIKAVLNATVKLSLSKFAVLIVLAWHKHPKTGICNPGERRIASETHMDRRAVRKVLKRLAADGAISVVQPKRGTQSTHYDLHLEWLVSGRPRRPQNDAASGRPRRPQNPAPAAASGRLQDSLVGALVHASGRPRRPNRSDRKIFERKIPDLRRVTTTPPPVPAAFETFWRAYPRKAAKADALKAFTKLAPNQQLVAAMLAAIDWQSQSPSWLKDDGRFVPYAATWIRGRRWEDERPHGEHVDATDAAWDALMRRHARKGVPQ